jgi:nucleolar protein 14
VEDIAPLSLLRLLGSGDAGADADYFSSPAFKTSAAAAAAALVARCAEVFADIDALPEIMSPALEALGRIVDAAAPAPATANGAAHADGSTTPRGKKKKKMARRPGGVVVAPGVAAACAVALATAQAACAAAVERRGPLCIGSMVAIPAARQFNPRFEEGYAAGKDYDPDRTRAEQRRLQRELRREERGAMRELRKDGAFMAGVRDRDREAAGNERDKSAKRAMSFLQQQESDFKSGGQGGMWKKKRHK